MSATRVRIILPRIGRGLVSVLLLGVLVSGGVGCASHQTSVSDPAEVLTSDSDPADAETSGNAESSDGSGEKPEELAEPQNQIVRLDPRATPSRQRVWLRLDPQQTSYQGGVEVDIAITEAIPELQFHAQDQEFTALALEGPGGAVEVETVRESQGLVRVRSQSELVPGDYKLQIDFTQDFNTHAVGLYRTEYQEASYLFTQFQALDARRAFPCWDEPGVKIPYQLTISVPSGNEVFTNTPVADSQSENGWSTIEFAETPPTPSYLLAIAAGPLESIPVEGLDFPARIVTTKGFSALGQLAAELTPPILAALEEYFGQPYPYEKLDQISVPEFWPGAMENPGAITYADRILLLDGEPGARRKRRLTQVMAHELAHMWFGDLVTMQWWDDLWLNESFAAWLENKIPDELYPELRAGMQGRVATQGVMIRDSRPSSRAIRRSVETSDDIFADIGVIYEKGAGVLSMVEQWLGEDAFRQGVRRYMEQHRWGNATSEDFWTALSAASGEDVAAILAKFVLQPGLPLVRVDQREGRYWVSQERFHAAGVEVEPMTWSIPITVRYPDQNGIQQQSVLLEGEPIALETTSEVQWLLPDSGAKGYYRWVIPNEMMLRLTGDSFSPRERRATLDNASALLDAGLLSGADYLALLEGFAADLDPDVLGGVLDGIEKVEEAFVEDRSREQFAAYLRAALTPVIEQFGWQKVEGEIETTHALRRRLFRLLGIRGQQAQVGALAKQLASDFFRDRSSVDAELASPALEVAAISGDRELFDRYKEGFENPLSPDDRGRYLSAMANFSDPEIHADFLEYGLSEAVKPTEFVAMFGGATTDQALTDRMEWAFTHYDEISAKLSEQAMSFIPFVAGGCSRERLDRAAVFFSDPGHQVAGTLARLQRVSEQVDQCLALRQREADSVEVFLSGFDGEE